MIKILIYSIVLVFGFFLGSIALSSPILDPIKQAAEQIKAGNINNAITILTLIAEKGDSIADWALVRIYIFSSSRYNNTEKGIESLLRLSARNNADSKEVLGDLYYYGRRVPQDYKKAAGWYADYVKYERDSDILTRYGLLFAMGKGVEKNKTKALHLFSEAVKKGYLPAFLLGKKVYQSMTPLEKFFLQDSN